MDIVHKTLLFHIGSTCNSNQFVRFGYMFMMAQEVVHKNSMFRIFLAIVAENIVVEQRTNLAIAAEHIYWFCYLFCGNR